VHSRLRRGKPAAGDRERVENALFRSLTDFALFSPFFLSAEAAISCGLPAKTLRKNPHGKLNHFAYENRVQNMWKRT
jgi:hypothetical protein